MNETIALILLDRWNEKCAYKSAAGKEALGEKEKAEDKEDVAEMDGAPLLSLMLGKHLLPRNNAFHLTWSAWSEEKYILATELEPLVCTFSIF